MPFTRAISVILKSDVPDFDEISWFVSIFNLHLSLSPSGLNCPKECPGNAPKLPRSDPKQSEADAEQSETQSDFCGVQCRDSKPQTGNIGVGL